MPNSLPKEVLVVEDEPLIRMTAADALADGGIMAWEASDAEEALEVLERRPDIGVVFTDMNMPGDMDGLALAHEVSAASSRKLGSGMWCRSTRSRPWHSMSA